MNSLLRAPLRPRGVDCLRRAGAWWPPRSCWPRALGTEFLPQLDEGVIWIRANLPPGISLEKSAEVARQMRAIITTIAGGADRDVAERAQRLGHGPVRPEPQRVARRLCSPYDTWPPGRIKRDLVEDLGRRLRAAIPGATFNFTQPIIDTSTEMATGSSADLAVIISGPDLKKLRELASRDARDACGGRRARRTPQSSRRTIRRSSASASNATKWRATASTSATCRT